MTQPTVRPSQLHKPVQSDRTHSVQQHFEDLYPAGNMQGWQTNGASRSLNSYAASPSTDAQVSAAAAPISPFSAGFPCSTVMNSHAFGNNNGLLMIPPATAMGTMYHGHTQDAAGFMNIAERHPTMIKAENESPHEQLWRYQMPQSNIQQHQSAVRTELNGVMSPTSPVNTLPSSQSSSSYSESPLLKESSSASSSPNFGQTTHYPVSGNMGLGIQGPRSGTFSTTNWPATHHDGVYGGLFRQQAPSWNWAPQQDSPGTAAWRQPMISREQFNLLQPFNPQQLVHTPQQSNVRSGTTTLPATGREIVFDLGVDPEHVANPRTQRHSSRMTEEPKPRDRENEILREGKRNGLTYKEIRAMMGTDIAESTLRGRWRALSKNKKDRVRKPVWTIRDIRLLKRNVLQQLNDLDDGSRTVDRNHLLSKISWKKASEYIRENGGTYTFGNATCKKKWLELEQERRVET